MRPSSQLFTRQGHAVEGGDQHIDGGFRGLGIGGGVVGFGRQHLLHQRRYRRLLLGHGGGNRNISQICGAGATTIQTPVAALLQAVDVRQVAVQVPELEQAIAEVTAHRATLPG